jgi:hypothetical protein
LCGCKDKECQRVGAALQKKKKKKKKVFTAHNNLQAVAALAGLVGPPCNNKPFSEIGKGKVALVL